MVVFAACGLSMSVVAWQTAIQQHIPAYRKGRVSAFNDIAEISLTPIGYLMVLHVTGAIGVCGTLLVCRIIRAAANDPSARVRLAGRARRMGIVVDDLLLARLNQQRPPVRRLWSSAMSKVLRS